MGLRSQIVTAVVAASSIISLFLCFYFLGEIRSNALQGLNSKIDKSVYMMKLVNARPLYNVDKETLRVNMETFFDDENMKRISISESDIEMDMTLERYFEPGGQDIHKAFYIYYKGLKLGRIEVTYNTGLIEKKLARFRVQMLTLTLGVICVLVVALILIINQLTQPVTRLAEAASEIADGNLDREIQEVGPGEVGVLSRNFAVMRDAIKEKMGALEAANRELEDELKQKAVNEIKILRQSQIISSVNIFFQKSMMATSYREVASLFIPIAVEVVPCAYLSVAVMEEDDVVDVLAVLENENPPSEACSDKILGMYTRHLATNDSSDVIIINQTESHPDFDTDPCMENLMLIPLRIGARMKGMLVFTDKDGGFGDQDREAGHMLGLALAESLSLKYQEKERLRLEEMMVQSEKMVSLGGLAAGMAHEINNPLAGILQNTQVIKNRLSNSNLPANVKAAQELDLPLDKLLKYMERRDIFTMMESVLTAGRRAAGIVTNMLSFSRKSASGQLPEDVGQLLEKTLELAESDYNLKKKFDFRKIAVIRDYEGDLPRIPCKASEIQQVFFNVLSNGAQAMMAANTTDPSFSIRLFRDQNYLTVVVQDNGPGMDAATRKRVFDPFFTTKGVGEGTGLGLAVSYFIITEKHRGKILVDSAPGKGTTFTIQLPMA